MKLKLFKDGSAMFDERTPMHDVTIEVNGSGYLHVGDKIYLIKHGKAHVGALEQGAYPVSVVCNNKIYRVHECLAVSDTGTAYVDGSYLWRYVFDLEEKIQKLQDTVSEHSDKLKKHEERISGPSLFGN